MSFLSVCVCGWEGLSPSVKKTPDNQKSPPGPNQGTEGGASVTKTGTAVRAEWALIHWISENGSVFSIISLCLKQKKYLTVGPIHCTIHFSDNQCTLILEPKILIHLWVDQQEQRQLF